MPRRGSEFHSCLQPVNLRPTTRSDDDADARPLWSVPHCSPGTSSHRGIRIWIYEAGFFKVRLHGWTYPSPFPASAPAISAYPESRADCI